MHKLLCGISTGVFFSEIVSRSYNWVLIIRNFQCWSKYFMMILEAFWLSPGVVTQYVFFVYSMQLPSWEWLEILILSWEIAVFCSQEPRFFTHQVVQLGKVSASICTTCFNDGEVMDDHSVASYLVSLVNIQTFSCFTGWNPIIIVTYIIYVNVMVLVYIELCC